MDEDVILAVEANRLGHGLGPALGFVLGQVASLGFPGQEFHLGVDAFHHVPEPILLGIQEKGMDSRQDEADEQGQEKEHGDHGGAEDLPAQGMEIGFKRVDRHPEPPEEGIHA